MVKEKGKKQIFYLHDQLGGLVNQIKVHYDEHIDLIGDPFSPESITSFKTSKAFIQVVPMLRKKLDVKFQVEESGDSTITVIAFEEEPIYVFLLWLRTIMAGMVGLVAPYLAAVELLLSTGTYLPIRVS